MSSWNFFFEIGEPQPLHQNDVYGFHLFQYSTTEAGKKPYIDLTNRKPPNKDVKAPPI
jgi:hypothetical protein